MYFPISHIIIYFVIRFVLKKLNARVNLVSEVNLSYINFIVLIIVMNILAIADVKVINLKNGEPMDNELVLELSMYLLVSLFIFRMAEFCFSRWKKRGD